jgi:hypothetical protein
MTLETWFILYALTKMVAYTAWSYWGICLFAPSVQRRRLLATFYGAVRLLMGMILGYFIFVGALIMNNAIGNAPLTYAAIYVPARICEWTVMFFIISRNKSRFRDVVIWIAGGILISCLADIPWGILNYGEIVPRGRPFC